MKERCRRAPDRALFPLVLEKRIESIVRLAEERVRTDPQSVLLEIKRFTGVELEPADLVALATRIQPGGGLGVSIVERRADISECG